MSRIDEICNIINEASLSRLFDHMKNHDCGTITAFRSTKDCGGGEKYTKQENLQRNKSLLAKLLNERYAVISVKGKYIENIKSDKPIEVGENVFFVADINNKGDLKQTLIKFGKHFDQDSILFIPKGGEKAILIGTNNCPNAFPGINKEFVYNKRQWGKTGQFFTRVKGRPFLFETILEEIPLPSGYFGRMGCNTAANCKWEDI